MDIDQPQTPRHAFLVERYLPASAAAGLAMSVAAVAKLCAEYRGVDDSVRYLQSLYVPSEDTCFCLFHAASADAVRAINTDGDFALDRITPAVLLLPQWFLPTPTDRETPS